MTQKAREEVSAEDAKESAELTQQLAVGTLHSTMDLNDCELLLAPSGGPAWPIEPKDDFTGQKTRSLFCAHRFLWKTIVCCQDRLRTNATEIECEDDVGMISLCFTGGLASSLAAVAGAPIITLPCGVWRGVLPLGVSLIGRRWADETVLAVAAALEAALPPPPAPQYITTIGGEVEGMGGNTGLKDAAVAQAEH